jgi:hypothetical protein
LATASRKEQPPVRSASGRRLLPHCRSTSRAGRRPLSARAPHKAGVWPQTSISGEAGTWWRKVFTALSVLAASQLEVGVDHRFTGIVSREPASRRCPDLATRRAPAALAAQLRSSPRAGLVQWRAQSPICIGNGGATWLPSQAPERRAWGAAALLLDASSGHDGGADALRVMRQ